MKPDFSLLYSELELPPDCSLEQFQSAYRRRIAELHPDKAGHDTRTQEAQDALPALISTYVEVNRFYRRYGRMPGASPRHAASNGPSSRQSTIPMAPRSTPSISTSASTPVPPASDESEQSGRPTVKLVILFLALLLLLASWDWVTLQAQ